MRDRDLRKNINKELYSAYAVFELENKSCITVYYFKDYCIVEKENEELCLITEEEFNKIYKVVNIIYP